MHRIYISLGSNVDRQKYTANGLDALAEHFSNLTFSRVFESESVGFEGSHFYNLVVGADTELSITQVCAVLKRAEQQNGRKRTEKKFAPRTLDLDLLLYDDVITNEGVELPRGEIEYNAFVLQPLAEIAPQEIHPVTGKTFASMWQAYDNKQKLWPVAFSWQGRQL